eukprot:GHRQ01023303.1.p2 GENE.GHRQ01023303.1~~GHRQ01023303.1.p2  ORF type:complete len:106 (-),score=4.79 GHRQ01023303.1:20-337(-)
MLLCHFSTCCQVRRKMEDENRKARRVQRREYLDNVRELVAFVKKRDKRMVKFQVRRLERARTCFSLLHVGREVHVKKRSSLVGAACRSAIDVHGQVLQVIQHALT